ncbi:MAG: SBBP repeat-containing protein, partial [Bryobacteraceae bacterium]
MLRWWVALLIPLACGQSLPALRWVQEIDNLGVDTFTGIGTDAQGNIYVAGNTTSPNFPVKAAVQSYLASAGLYRIDGTGSAYSRVGSKFVVSRLAADPLNPNVFYGVSPTSPVKSLDGGNTWTPLSQVSEVWQFAVDPSNDQNVYAAGFDQGFFKSSDGGATWNLINNGITLSEDSLAWGIWIDPNSGVLFGDYGDSVVRSADGGASWQTVASAYTFTLYFETPKPGVLYIFNGANNVLKSTDDGQTFQTVTIPVTSIFADPTRAGRLLGNGQGGIFESDDDGVTWALALPFAGGIAAADWANGVLYAYMSAAPGVFQISSNLKTVTPVGPPGIAATGLVVSNGHVYVPNSGL